MIELKQRLHDLCSEYIATKENAIKKIIENAREAANNETKSSAGDKYETGRELMQQEIDMNLRRLNDLRIMQVTLSRIPTDVAHTRAQPGSIVYTDHENYYLSVSAGKLNVLGDTFYAVSMASPVGAKMAGLGHGDWFPFNGKKVTIRKML